MVHRFGSYQTRASQIYQAIRNRGYTNERQQCLAVKEFETQGGEFCLYSREFDSLRQSCFYYSTKLGRACCLDLNFSSKTSQFSCSIKLVNSSRL